MFVVSLPVIEITAAKEIQMDKMKQYCEHCVDYFNPGHFNEHNECIKYLKEHPQACPKCAGTGKEYGKPTLCPKCNGSGVIPRG